MRGLLGHPYLVGVAVVLVIALLSPATPVGRGLPWLSGEALTVGPQEYGQTQGGDVEILQVEAEPVDTTGANDAADTAELVDGFGTGDGDARHAVITGDFAAPAATVAVDPPAAAEDDGAVDLAVPLGLAAGEQVLATGTIGDGPHGSAGTRRGDVDMWAVTVPAGLRLQVEVRAPDGSDLQAVLGLYDTGGTLWASDERGGGGADARLVHRPVSDADMVIAVGALGSGRPLDPFDSASGLGVASEGDYELRVQLVDDDLDVYAVDLTGGDVLGATVTGAGLQVQVFDGIEGVLALSSTTDLSAQHPPGSPLGGGGPHVDHVVADHVTEQRWFVAVSGRHAGGTQGTYELALEAMRPAMERAPTGIAQTFLLDLDGASVDGQPFGGTQPVGIDPLADQLAAFGLGPGDLPAVEQAMLAEFTRIIDEQGPPAGWTVTTDPLAAPAGTTSTIVVGGTSSPLGASIIAAAPTVDVGNVDPAETGVVLTDLLAGPAGATGSLRGAEGGVTPALLGRALGILSVHVAGGMLGARVSVPSTFPHVMDDPATILAAVEADFPVSAYGGFVDPRQGAVGYEDTGARIVAGLAVGADDVDDPPVVADDAVDLPLGVLDVPAPGVLANDRDPELGPLTVALVDGPSAGVLDLRADGGFTYTPDDPDAPVVDAFTYTASDGGPPVGPATVTLAPCGGTELVNGSFETGDLTGWCVSESATVLFPATVVGSDDPVPGLGAVAPSDGDQALVSAWEGLVDGATTTLIQLLDVPTGVDPTAVTLDWRARWDLAECGGCAPRTLGVVVEAVGGPGLLDQTVLTAAAGTTEEGTAGTVDLPLDLSSVAGDRIRLSLVIDHGDGLSGPAQLELDAVTLALVGDPEPTPTPTPTPTGSPTPTPTGSPTPTASPSATPTPGPGGGLPGGPGLPGPTPTPSAEPTATPTPGPTVDPNPTTGPAEVPPGVTRLQGAGREQTAVAASRMAYPQARSAGAVVLARRDSFADGLAGAPLAAAVDGPLLLTGTDGLHPATRDEIIRVLGGGGTVHVLGGTAAISDRVVAELEQLAYRVVRSAGASRFQTAVAIADRVEAALGEVQVAFLVTGNQFPDALAAGPVAIDLGGAILLTDDDSPHPDTQRWLDAHTRTSRVAIGGQAAQAHPTIEGIFGAGREATAVAVAERFFRRTDVVGVARNDDFADALGGGVVMGRLGGPLLLTGGDELHQAPRGWLEEHDAVASALLFGGPAALTETVRRDVAALVE
ncbi:cell wall-binding repeat-containing protein [Euzebya rosea]|uniref:cell wall-binding repeat-containing protein n=1 Tax=Euzebya rosea TaxID=2052804 RepID=UPI0013007456|nr:cell wall-binding repeat-containing protein [Euzebya rosea]